MEGGAGGDRGAADEPRARVCERYATTSACSAPRTPTSTTLQPRLADELTEENFDDAYAELVGQYEQAGRPRSEYRKEARSAADRVRRRRRSTRRRQARRDAAAQQERGRRAEHHPADARDTSRTAAIAMQHRRHDARPSSRSSASTCTAGRRRRVEFGGNQLSKAAKYGADMRRQGGRRVQGPGRAARPRWPATSAAPTTGLLQANVAASELEQIGRQILASLIARADRPARVPQPPAADRATRRRSISSCDDEVHQRGALRVDAGRALAPVLRATTASRSTPPSGPSGR